MPGKVYEHKYHLCTLRSYHPLSCCTSSVETVLLKQQCLRIPWAGFCLFASSSTWTLIHETVFEMSLFRQRNRFVSVASLSVISQLEVVLWGDHIMDSAANYVRVKVVKDDFWFPFHWLWTGTIALHWLRDAGVMWRPFHSRRQRDTKGSSFTLSLAYLQIEKIYIYFIEEQIYYKIKESSWSCREIFFSVTKYDKTCSL